jgi:hypothetical protein
MKSPRQPSDKPEPAGPPDAAEPSGTPAGKDRGLMPRPDKFPDDRPKVKPPPSRDQGRNRSI